MLRIVETLHAYRPIMIQGSLTRSTYMSQVTKIKAKIGIITYSIGILRHSCIFMCRFLKSCVCPKSVGATTGIP